MGVVDRSFGNPMKIEEKACAPLAGGIMQYGYQCGMVWGGAFAAGAHAYRLLGAGQQAEIAAVIASQRIVESFRACNKHIDCSEITEMEWKPSSKRKAIIQILKFFIKGGPIGCFRMTAGYAPVAFNEINAALIEKTPEEPGLPVSCAAVLAQKIGLSDMHTVMASGLAGGIGLSGGACGALGAAIWISGIKYLEQGNSKVDYKNPGILAMIDKFLKCTDYEFECSEIVGRKFKNIDEHSAHLRDGGCAKIIDELAVMCSNNQRNIY